jgi:TetR/AcrR family transcriptional regulator, cholesterol catabolism regulator
MDDDRESIPTRQRLLTGAAGLFREKGYAGTTTRALSALAGIQNGSLYHHVGGKEDLLYGLCVEALDDVATLFRTEGEGDGEPIARLERVAKGYVELALRDRDRHATMLSEIRSLSSSRREQVIALRDANVAIVEDLVAEAQQKGQVRSDVAAKYLTLALFNLLNWTIFWFDPQGELAEQEIAQILWSVFASGTLAPGRT